MPAPLQSKFRLDELEAAVFERNPALAQRLKPPLSEREISKILRKANIPEAMEPVIALYSWRNGTAFGRASSSPAAGFFPQSIYEFIDLEKAVQHMRSHQEIGVFRSSPTLTDRYLPLFWNCATNWLAIDVKGSENNPVVLIRFFAKEASLKDGRFEPEIPEKDPPREVHKTFEDFIADAIRANRENAPLACFA